MTQAKDESLELVWLWERRVGAEWPERECSRSFGWQEVEPRPEDLLELWKGEDPAGFLAALFQVWAQGLWETDTDADTRAAAAALVAGERFYLPHPTFKPHRIHPVAPQLYTSPAFRYQMQKSGIGWGQLSERNRKRIFYGEASRLLCSLPLVEDVFGGALPTPDSFAEQAEAWRKKIKYKVEWAIEKKLAELQKTVGQADFALIVDEAEVETRSMHRWEYRDDDGKVRNRNEFREDECAAGWRNYRDEPTVAELDREIGEGATTRSLSDMMEARALGEWAESGDGAGGVLDMEVNRRGDEEMADKFEPDWEAVEALTPRKQQVWVLVECLGLEPKQAAQWLGTTSTAARVALCKARDRVG